MRSFFLLFTFSFLVGNVCGQTENAKLKISPLFGDFYVYTTYGDYKGNKVPANGMYILTENGVVLFDTPWDTTQFQPLLDSIQMKHNKTVSICIATHWHSDRTAGLEYYQQQKIRTYTTVLTDNWSKKNNEKRAEFLMKNDTVFKVGQYSFEVYYPGEGHTADNIVVWFGKEKVLYGGCLIKGADAKSLGNLSDANINEYATTLKRVKTKCTSPKYIIVSHSDWNNKNSLKHSLHLAKKLRKKK